MVSPHVILVRMALCLQAIELSLQINSRPFDRIQLEASSRAQPNRDERTRLKFLVSDCGTTTPEGAKSSTLVRIANRAVCNRLGYYRDPRQQRPRATDNVPSYLAEELRTLRPNMPFQLHNRRHCNTKQTCSTNHYNQSHQ